MSLVGKSKANYTDCMLLGRGSTLRSKQKMFPHPVSKRNMYPDNYSLTAVPTQENTRIYALTPHSNTDTLSVKPDIKVTAT